MHRSRRPRDALSLAQECGFFLITVNEMYGHSGLISERDRDHEAGESTTGPEVGPNPCLRRKIEKLKRIRDVARPQVGDGRGRDEVGGTLPAQ